MTLQRGDLKSMLAVTLAALIVLTTSFVNAEGDTAAERILWDKRPISVHIQRGQERIIHFPDEVRYWLPDALKRKVSVISANGVLYVRALEIFPKTRIRIQGLTDHQIYLLDVVADDAVSVSDELIVMTKASVSNRAKTQSAVRQPVDWRVRLTRYAAQQLYAPERLLGSDGQIKRVAIDDHKAISLVRGQRVEATPIASWQGGGFTVTALKLRNITAQSLRLVFDGKAGFNDVDLAMALRGDWLTATSQHDTLGPAGKPDDTTTLYLVSKRSFAESLGYSVTSNVAAGEAEDG